MKYLKLLIAALLLGSVHSLKAQSARTTPIVNGVFVGNMNADQNTITNLAPGVNTSSPITVGQVNETNNVLRSEMSHYTRTNHTGDVSISGALTATSLAGEGSAVTGVAALNAGTVTGVQSGQLVNATAHLPLIANTTTLGHVKAGAVGTGTTKVRVHATTGEATVQETDPQAVSLINDFLRPIYYPGMWNLPDPSLQGHFSQVNVLVETSETVEEEVTGMTFTVDGMYGPMSSIYVELFDEMYYPIGSCSFVHDGSLQFVWDGTITWDGEWTMGDVWYIETTDPPYYAYGDIEVGTHVGIEGDTLSGLQIKYAPDANFYGTYASVTDNSTLDQLWDYSQEPPMIAVEPWSDSEAMPVSVMVSLDLSGALVDYYTLVTAYEGAGTSIGLDMADGITAQLLRESTEYQPVLAASQVTNYVVSVALSITNAVDLKFNNYYTKAVADGRYATPASVASTVTAAVKPLYDTGLLGTASHFTTNFNYAYSVGSTLNGRKVWNKGFTNFVVTASDVTIMFDTPVSSTAAAIAGDFVDLSFNIPGMQHYQGVYQATNYNAGRDTVVFRPSRATKTMGIATSVYSNASIGRASRAHPMFVVSHSKQATGTTPYREYSIGFNGLITGQNSGSESTTYGNNLASIDSTISTHAWMNDGLSSGLPHVMARSASVTGAPYRLGVWYDSTGSTAISTYSNIVCIVPDWHIIEGYDLSPTDDTLPRMTAVLGTVTYRSVSSSISTPTFTEAWSLSSR